MQDDWRIRMARKSCNALNAPPDTTLFRQILFAHTSCAWISDYACFLLANFCLLTFRYLISAYPSYKNLHCAQKCRIFSIIEYLTNCPSRTLFPVGIASCRTLALPGSQKISFQVLFFFVGPSRIPPGTPLVGAKVVGPRRLHSGEWSARNNLLDFVGISRVEDGPFK